MGHQCCCTEDGYCEMSRMMLKIADDAWYELMKEKMKAEYEKKRGEKMSKAAKIGVQHSIEFWETKMKNMEMKKEKIEEFKKELMGAFKG